MPKPYNYDRAAWNKWRKEWRKRPEVAAREKAYRDRPEVKARVLSVSHAWHRNNLPKRLFNSAKCRAKDLGLPFSITVGDITVPEFCPILGIKLFVGDGASCPNSPTLDRILPDAGYIPGNVCVISARANVIKYNATIEELEAVLKYYKAHVSKGVA